MEKRGKRCYGLSATRATSTERHTAQEKRRAPSWRGCRPVNSGKSFSAARRWFHPASSRLLLAWCSEYPPGHPHTGCNMGHVAAKNIICPPPFAQAHNAHQDIRNMPTAQIPFLAPSLSLSLSLPQSLSRGRYGLTSMMSASESTPAAGISATSAAGTSAASGDPTSSVSVSTAADMIRMFRTAARDCCARVRHTAAWYLCAGTMRCVGRTLCRKADVDPARPSMIARGRFTRTDLILKSLRREGGRERGWATSRKRGARQGAALGLVE